MNNVRMVYSTKTAEKPKQKRTTTKIVSDSFNNKLEWKITAKTDHAECHELFCDGVSIKTKWLPLMYKNSSRSKL